MKGRKLVARSVTHTAAIPSLLASGPAENLVEGGTTNIETEKAVFVDREEVASLLSASTPSIEEMAMRRGGGRTRSGGGSHFTGSPDDDLNESSDPSMLA